MENDAAPQMLVIKDHFRKAKIMPTIPERHMKDMRTNIKERWNDFVDNIFPSVTIVDNHGVKTWSINSQSVMTNIVIPFLKLKYGMDLSNESENDELMSKDCLKYTFFNLCDELVTGLLLKAENDEYKHLMRVFKPDNLDAGKKTKISDYHNERIK